MDEHRIQDYVIKVQRYRWMILFLFCSLIIINFMQLLQYTIITNWIMKYYNVGSTAVHMTGTVFFIVYILLFLPVNYLIEKYELRITVITSSILTLAGTSLKLLSCHPAKFHIALIGQAICACGQVYILSIPSKLASSWFGPKEVSTACSLAAMSIQIGSAIGSILPPYLISDETVDSIGGSMYRIMTWNAVAAGIVCSMILLLFRTKPDHFPSKAQLQLFLTQQSTAANGICQLYRNSEFHWLLFIFGTSFGVYNSLTVVYGSIYINYFPNGETDLGIITVLSVISGGCLGNVFIGHLLDKTHQFKRLSIAVFTLACTFFILQIYTLRMSYRTASFFSVPIFEFVAAPIYPLGIEFVSEISYPVPASTSCAVLNAFIYVTAISFTFIIDWLIQLVGYFSTLIAILGVYVVCNVSLLFVSSNYKRSKINAMVDDID